MKVPCSFDWYVLEKPVAALLTVTLAFATAAPFGSAILPLIEPVVSCAYNETNDAKHIAIVPKIKRRIFNFISCSPLEFSYRFRAITYK